MRIRTGGDQRCSSLPRPPITGRQQENSGRYYLVFLQTGLSYFNPFTT